MRKSISIILAVILLIGTVLLAKYLIDNKKQSKPVANNLVKTVFAQKVQNSSIPIIITANGSLLAKNKIELYSEVQGVMEKSMKEFKSGTHFNQGDVLVKMNSAEFFANLQAQKSNLYNALTAVMPDIRLDFPSEYEKWEQYLQQFKMNEPLQSLPEINSEKEKFFISGRGIFSHFYNVKNLEVKLQKYTLKAPFKGVLTEALITPGTLIRVGQKLGEFIDTSLFEIAVDVKSQYRSLLEIGKNVSVYNLNKTQSWKGKVVRINGKVDTASQTLKVFIELSGNNLKEGEYLTVEIDAKEEENAFEVSRKLLVDNDKLYVVRDSVLDLITINPVFENKNTMVVKGIENGTQILSKPIPGAHAGMLVKIYNENNQE